MEQDSFLKAGSEAGTNLISNDFQVEVSSTLSRAMWEEEADGTRSSWRICRPIPTRPCIRPRRLKSFLCELALDASSFVTWSRRYVGYSSYPRHPDLLKGIYAAGFKRPSKIQERALPLLLMNA
jgi:hypothetical protein